MPLFRRYGPVPFDPSLSTEDLVSETLRIYVGQRTELKPGSRLSEDLGILGDDRDELFRFLGATFKQEHSREDCQAIRTVAELVSLFSSPKSYRGQQDADVR
jgi:hypothetical protein